MIRLKSLLPMQYQQVVLFYFIFVQEINILSPRHRHENESVKMRFHRLGEIIIFCSRRLHDASKSREPSVLDCLYKKKSDDINLIILGIYCVWISALPSIWIPVWSACGCFVKDLWVLDSCPTFQTWWMCTRFCYLKLKHLSLSSNFSVRS